MSVFRFQATPTTSTPLSRRMKGKRKDSGGPTFAFSTSPSLLQDITLDKTDMGMSNSPSGGLTMKEYEEQLKKLTAENFNLKLRVYFVEERLSKVTGISDKEDLIKKNIQLKVTCESQLKELEKKQELLFEASKAFELLQKEHAEEIERLIKEKDKEHAELEEKLTGLEAKYLDLKSRFPDIENDPNAEMKSFEDYEAQIRELETHLRDEEERFREAEIQLKDQQLEIESYNLKTQRLESELEQRVQRIEELVDELEQKERDLASANFRIRKLEDEIKAKLREDEIMKERIEEKNKTIESLKNSLSTRDETIEVLENRVAKERSSSQSMQSKIDSLAFQNARLKEELDILQSRLRRTADSLSPRGKSKTCEEDGFKQKYEELIRVMEEREMIHAKRMKEVEERLSERESEAEDYQELFEKHKKLEDDHRKACTALKNFIKRSSEEKKEKEALNRMLNTQEEVIADLTAQLEQYKNLTVFKPGQDDKLSLAETGDNDRKLVCAVGDSPRSEKDKINEEKFGKEKIVTFKEKVEKMSELEAEVIILEQQLDVKDMNSKEVLLNELEVKKNEISRLKEELQKRNVNMQELVNKELWDKNKQIEKFEKRLAEISEANKALHREIIAKDEKLKMLNVDNKLDEKKKECLQSECIHAKEQAERADAMRKEAAEVCTLLSVRLEELTVFLDSLLTNGDLLNGISMRKQQDIRRAMEKSRELSRHLSLSFAKRNANDSSFGANSLELVANGDGFSLTNESIFAARDKVISEQSIIIERLREQLKILNQEIKQRDIELSHCQGDFEERSVMSEGIEGQSFSICQEISDDEDEDEEANEECLGFVNKYANEEKRTPTQETSESETWSEPDRSVSLARMGLEEAGINARRKISKCDVSSESSEGTLNENPRNTGKRCRSTESEVRRLQSRIKALDEINENLRAEINFLKSEKQDANFASRLQMNEGANLMEKLRKTMERLEECSLTCRQLEDKLAGALERASTTAMQLSKAQETISDLEQEINTLKNEIALRKLETNEKEERIAELEKKMKEMTVESEAKIVEAMKQKEAAEKKTLEVECRLKDAENMSKEVESKVNEIEKKISETKRFKNETVIHFKEAEKHVDTAEKMMEEAERIKTEAERKSKDFQNFIDLMRKEVEEKLKEAEKRVKKSEKEKEELEKQVVKLKKRLLEAEKNKTEVEMKVKEGKETIQCMEEKLKELEVAMDQCSEEAQRKIKEIQKKADARVTELEIKIEEREFVRKTETEKKMAEAEKLSRELEVGFKRQLEEAEKKVKKARETAEATIKKIKEEAEKQEAELRQQLVEIELQKEEDCSKLRKQLDEAKLEASELELELTKLTNEKIHLEEELRRVLEKESALVKDNKEIKGKYELSIHELENKLTQLALNKSHLAARLEEIESTNIDLVSRISAIRGKETMVVEREFTTLSPPYSPPHGSFVSTLFGEFDFPEMNGNTESSTMNVPGEAQPGTLSMEAFAVPRRQMNSSPDLGIESDPGRFSSLEACQQANGDQIAILGCVEASEIKKLEAENAELKRRLVRTRQALEETLTQLSAANQRKKQVERAICKQLHKTHHILKKARVNFESQEDDGTE